MKLYPPFDKAEHYVLIRLVLRNGKLKFAKHVFKVRFLAEPGRRSERERERERETERDRERREREQANIGHIEPLQTEMYQQMNNFTDRYKR